MAKFRVQTAELDIVIEANNHRMAAIKAIDEHTPKALGALISVLKEGDTEDDEIYMKSEFVLECMGYKVS